MILKHNIKCFDYDISWEFKYKKSVSISDVIYILDNEYDSKLYDEEIFDSNLNVDFIKYIINYRQTTYLYDKVIYYVFEFKNKKYVAICNRENEYKHYKYMFNKINKMEKLMNIDSINGLQKYSMYIHDEEIRNKNLKYCCEQLEIYGSKLEDRKHKHFIKLILKHD